MSIFERVAVAEEPADKVATAMNVPVHVVYQVKHRVLTRMRRISQELEGST